MNNDALRCLTCGAGAQSLGVTCNLDDGSLHRVLVCDNGHVQEDDVSTKATWSRLALEHNVCARLLEGDLLPYEADVVAKRRGDHWNTVKPGALLDVDLLLSLKACPFCRSTSTSVVLDGETYTVSCDACDAYGPDRKTFAAAVASWNTDRT
jgi:transcription elongation factor Elf1